MSLIAGDIDVQTVIEDWPCTGERTNLLQLACKWELTDAIELLLEEGADVRCPGLAETALVYYARRPRDNETESTSSNKVLFRRLLEHSECSVLQNLKEVFAAKIEAFEDVISKLRHNPARLQYKRGNVTGHSSTASVTSAAHPPYARTPTDCVPEYDYDVLEGIRTIRLLELEPADSPQSPVICKTKQAELSQCPPFEALSYRWGDSTEIARINLNGALFQVTQSLLVSLRRLRHPTTSRWLWVDAMCINQADSEEKSRQVSIMGDIYRTAQRVVMWVGESGDNSHLIFDHLRSWYQWCEDYKAGKVENDVYGEKHLNPPRYGGDVKAAFDVFTRRPYFFRTWVIQEISLSNNAIILCGPDSAPLKDVWKPSSFHHPDTSYHAFRGKDGPTHLHDIGALMPNAHIKDIVKVSRFCGATDLRDKVFGILGLFSEQLLPVDYNATVENIYRDFTKAVIQQHNSLEVLHWLGPRRRLTGLCSWVPDWSISDPVGVLPRAFGTWFMGSDFPKTCLEGVEFHGDQLTVKGKMLDSISDVGDELIVDVDCSPSTQRFTSIIRQWQVMAAPLVCKHGASALESFANTLTGVDPRYQLNGRTDSTPSYLLWDSAHGPGDLRKELPRHVEQLELTMAVLARDHIRSQVEASIHGYADRMEIACYGRRFFVTSNESMGLAPPRARNGDLIALFPGGLYPFVVRPMGDDKYELVGDCLLENLDAGRLFESNNEIPVQKFVLC